MIVTKLITSTTESIIVLDKLNAIEYDENTGELFFVTSDAARPVFLDKGTPSRKVWDYIHEALRTIYEGRSGQTHACQVTLDLRKFQTQEAKF